MEIQSNRKENYQGVSLERYCYIIIVITDITIYLKACCRWRQSSSCRWTWRQDLDIKDYGQDDDDDGGLRKDKQKKFTFCIGYRTRPTASALVYIMDAIILHRTRFFCKFQGSYLFTGYSTLRISGWKQSVYRQIAGCSQLCAFHEQETQEMR